MSECQILIISLNHLQQSLADSRGWWKKMTHRMCFIILFIVSLTIVYCITKSSLLRHYYDKNCYRGMHLFARLPAHMSSVLTEETVPNRVSFTFRGISCVSASSVDDNGFQYLMVHGNKYGFFSKDVFHMLSCNWLLEWLLH